MKHCLWLMFLLINLLVWTGRGSTAQVKLTPPCEDDGLLAWGQFSDGRTSPSMFKSSCDGTVAMTGIMNAAGSAANQLAAFSVGRGVAFNGNVNWNATTPVTVTFPDPKVLKLQVWVLYTRSDCDFSCVQTKVGEFIIWANERSGAERTGIQFEAASNSWISDQTTLAQTQPVKSLLNFSEDGSDCATVRDSFPASIKNNAALNLYIIRTEAGLNHRGIYCSEARDRGFANAFVASRATYSTMLHELSHNLGLGHSAANLNVMNQAIQDGVFYSEGQTFRMNFSRSSALNITLAPHPASEQRDCDNTPPEGGCPAEATWIWPDP